MIGLQHMARSQWKMILVLAVLLLCGASVSAQEKNKEQERRLNEAQGYLNDASSAMEDADFIGAEADYRMPASQTK